LRVRAQLTELHTNDLRFTNKEATAFLHQSLSQPLTNAQIATLQTQTEGWIAGLQLAMLSLREAANSETLIESFSGSQRDVLDYLVEEVLEQQSPHVREFLLRTSILGQMCHFLCEAVVGEAVVHGTDTLEQLERQNLFVVPLDHNRT
jgi:LuxR family maltose regulon positive regulatory protein